MNWTVVDFGKYRGKNKILPQIVFDDPDWFFWMYERRHFQGSLALEAEYVARRARLIKVPSRDELPRVAEYTQGRDGKFAMLELVEESRPFHPRSVRYPWIDLGYPFSLHGYDKSGGRRIVRQAKFVLFGNESYQMTRERAAAFFDDDRNFEFGSSP
jgi:hypothetical protein